MKVGDKAKKTPKGLFCSGYCCRPAKRLSSVAVAFWLESSDNVPHILDYDG